MSRPGERDPETGEIIQPHQYTIARNPQTGERMIQNVRTGEMTPTEGTVFQYPPRSDNGQASPSRRGASSSSSRSPTSPGGRGPGRTPPGSGSRRPGSGGSGAGQGSSQGNFVRR